MVELTFDGGNWDMLHWGEGQLLGIWGHFRVPPGSSKASVQMAPRPHFFLPPRPEMLAFLEKQRESAAALALLNSMWHQSAATFRPSLLQAWFHNLSNVPDHPPPVQEVMHSGSLPALGAANWPPLGMFKISTEDYLSSGPSRGRGLPVTVIRLMGYSLCLPKKLVSLSKRSQNYILKCLWVVRVTTHNMKHIVRVFSPSISQRNQGRTHLFSKKYFAH